MIDIKNISVSDQFGTEYLCVSFTISDTHDDLNKYIFNLYRSHTQSSGFELIGIDILRFEYIDSDVNLYDLYSNYYYRVEIVNRYDTSERILSDVIGEYKGKTPDNESSTIIHLHNIYLTTIVKNKMLLLKKRRFGQICNCYDEIRERSSVINCEDCYGTSFFGGYYEPYLIYVNFFNTPSYVEKFSYSDISEDEGPVQLWTANYPTIQPQDILIDAENNRHVISSCQRTKKNYYVLRQIIQIHRLPKTNIVYSIDAGSEKYDL